jgi:hypothetical protein
MYPDDNAARKPPAEGQKKEKRLPLSGGAIKAIGLALMVVDHLHQMFINQGVPGWFSWLGRPVAAMFLFLCAEGFHYTRSRKLYILRFLAAFVLMNFANLALNKFLYVENVVLINNMFGTLFMSVFYMLMIDLFREGLREKMGSRILLALGGIILSLVTGIVLLSLISRGASLNFMGIVLFLLVPSPFTVEGGFFLVAAGVLFYLLRKYRPAQALVPAAAGLFALLAGRTESGLPGSSQWLMLFAALPVLLYNGRRGRGGKYFFYIFYPAHIYLFYLAAWFLQAR